MRDFLKKLPFGAGVALLANAVLASAVMARVPDDTYYLQQWHLAKIRAAEAWEHTLGFEGVTIAVIDSGVDIEHPDLKDNIWRNTREIAGNGIDDDRNGYVDDVHGWDFVGNDADPRPDVSGEYTVLGANHGTVDAGIAAARGGNGRGVTGVAWQSTIMPLRALDATGNGEPGSVVQAVEYAMHNGAKIINLSFAGPSSGVELGIAVRRAYDAGVLVVAAAGNAPDDGRAVDLDRYPLAPVCLDRRTGENFVYGVAAVDEQDRLAAFSNYGDCVDISAPGSRMISTQLRVPGNREFTDAYGGFYNGTSLSAAAVSGVASLVWALDRNFTPKQIISFLDDSAANIDAANPGRKGAYGKGRLDAAGAVEKALTYLRSRNVPVTPTSALLPTGASQRMIVTAPGKGRAPDIRLFTPDGLLIRSFMAFPESFRGGVNLAVANLDGSGRRSIVAGAMAGGTPHVRLFDVNSRPLGAFLAYDAAFGGGVSVAAGDLDGDGRDEIVTGAGPGGGPHVRIFTPNGVAIGGFFAFAKTSRLGVNVAVTDLDGDGKGEIVTSAPNGVAVRTFSAKGVMLAEQPLKDWRLARNIPADAPASVLTPGSVWGSAARTAPLASIEASRGGALRFYAYEPAFRGGVSAVLTE